MKAFLQSPVGVIEIEETNGFISALRVVSEMAQTDEALVPVLAEAIKQLKEYFAGERETFDLPLAQEGTAFQQ